MARIGIFETEVQEVVRELVIRLAATQTVAALVRQLNETLAASGDDRRLHANRVTPFFSDDPSRGINEATLETVRSAIRAAPVTDSQLAAFVHLADQVKTHKGLGFGNEDIARVLNITPAAVRLGLGDPVDELKDEKLVSRVLDSTPDWSHQEVAIARVMDAFRRRPAGRIGLVLPTGAGKTRVALRIILERLASAPALARVVWITHRKTLKRQAFRQLNKLLQSKSNLPADADKLANRIIFAMVGQIETLISANGPNLALVVVDEAHHAAAPSYAGLFSPDLRCPVLLLTATPNRPDALPIGVEEIAYTITYRELAERRVIQIPNFLPFAVDDFDWSASAVRQLADWLVDETAGRFRKVLILAPQVSRVEEFYEAFLAALRNEQPHPLLPEDVGYIHGGRNSLGIPDEDFLERFEDKPRAVLVSAQMLLEGFDDPAVDTVVLTYPTSSVIRLMQAAGRAVRYHPGKAEAYVVQADNANLAYRFDQRWLYQELDDYLRPEIIDTSYAAGAERRLAIEELLERHNVSNEERAAALKQVDEAHPQEDVRLLFYGKPYFGAAGDFDAEAKWGVFVETPANSVAFRQIFNSFSAMGAHLSDPTDFMTKQAPGLGIAKDLSQGSTWRQFGLILTAAYCAREEIYGTPNFGLQGNRPKPEKGPTTWLRYATFKFEPRLPASLAAFLADCHNRQEIENAYLDDIEGFEAVAKVSLPLAGSEALLLRSDTFCLLQSRLQELAAAMRLAAPADRYAALAAQLATGQQPPLPSQFITRIEQLFEETPATSRILKFER
ncbi:DEAD/DEAH box helicase family protein [Rhizobium sp. AN63]|uniref:DEAD/DEAH box helicase n=1 Tax=Rhizobium sp. AN63 TaxID=3035210 RepID=UPI0027D37B16|nr:DEAD/DEAH box helicase family protein [Rhizobium sp. AN63]MDQ4408685.1 DEAD/DEAH box helicase family protein [Rhizobium sp. AN63]